MATTQNDLPFRYRYFQPPNNPYGPGSIWPPNQAIVSYTGPETTALIDAFGRLRVSNPFTLFDSSYRYKDNDKYNAAFTGSATGAINSSTSIYEMSVSSPSSSILRESKLVFPYQPGKSLEIFCSFVGSDNSYTQSFPNSLYQAIGFYSELNGIYVSIEDGVVYMNIKNNGSVERVAQNNWNTDRLNGTGPSGYTLDITKAQIFYCDLEWLGVGTVNVGFIINSNFIIVHKFYHANIITSTYMTTATLPIRYEIRAGASYNGGTSTFKQICATVISEGGYQGISTKKYITNATGTNGVGPIVTALASIRMVPTRLDSIVLPAQTDLFLTSSGNIQYRLIKNGTLNTPSWVNYNLASSNVQYDLSSTRVTGGEIIDSNFVASSNTVKNTLTVQGIDQFSYQLGRQSIGVSDTLTLAAISYGGTEQVSFNFGWYELN
jgi:hypothetical protein